MARRRDDDEPSGGMIRKLTPLEAHHDMVDEAKRNEITEHLMGKPLKTQADIRNMGVAIIAYTAGGFVPPEATTAINHTLEIVLASATIDQAHAQGGRTVVEETLTPQQRQVAGVVEDADNRRGRPTIDLGPESVEVVNKRPTLPSRMRFDKSKDS